jgi:hypothetical protein
MFARCKKVEKKIAAGVISRFAGIIKVTSRVGTNPLMSRLSMRCPSTDHG